MKETQGYVIEVTNGIHKGKKGYAYHVNQTTETRDAKKAIIVLEGEKDKVMLNASYCKIIGHCD